MSLSHFDEKSGTVCCFTNFGRWWQTVTDVHIELCLPEKSRGKDLVVTVSPTTIKCSRLGVTLLEGELFYTVHPEDTVWTVEESYLLHILLSKAKIHSDDILWEALFSDASFAPDALTLHEMRKKFDLEKFQIENPGMDFSQAKLQKCYDTP